MASKDRLDILFPNINQLVLNDEEWLFLIKSSFSIFWYPNKNKWIDAINKERLSIICKGLLQDKTQGEIVEYSIRTLSKIEGKDITPTLIELIQSPKVSDSIKETAISQYRFSICDIRIINILKHIISNNKNYKLRKTAISALAHNLQELSNSDTNIIGREIGVIYKALDDSYVSVRKEATDILGYRLPFEKSVPILIQSFHNEWHDTVKKTIISSLGILLEENLGANQIIPLLESTSKNEKEDYRVREEARWRLEYYKGKKR